MQAPSIFWMGDWSPQHGLVGTGNFLGKVQLWDANGQFLREFEAHEAGISQIAISLDGKTIATGNDNSYMAIMAKMELRLWNTAGELQYTLRGSTDRFLLSYSLRMANN